MALLLLLACGDPTGTKDAAADTADTRSDSDPDADTASGADSADTHSDTDSDTHSAADTHTDTASHSDTGADTGPVDADADGHPSVESGGDDCDDTDATVFPGAPTDCTDDVINDCTRTGEACGPCTGAQTDATATGLFTGSDSQGIYSLQRGDDLDGDGVGDLVAEGFGASSGRGSGVYLWASASAGSAVPADTRTASAAYLASSTGATWVPGAGDVDGDGTADVALTDAGALVVVPASAVTDGATLGSADAWFSVVGPGYFFGAASGDVDADAAPDLAVEDSWADEGRPYEGAVYLYTHPQVEAGGTLSAADATTTLRGGASGRYADLSAMVDVNGDGVADVVMTYWPTGATVDSVFFGPLPAGTLALVDADLTVTLAGDTSSGLGPAGDLDGDGLGDLSASRTTEEGGFVYLGGGALTARAALDADAYDLHFGARSGWSAFPPAALGGDFDGDGEADVLVGAGENAGLLLGGLVYSGPFRAGGSFAAADATVTHELPFSIGTGAASFSVQAAGDLDLDGQPDLTVGLSADDGAATDAGIVWIFSGCTL